MNRVKKRIVQGALIQDLDLWLPGCTLDPLSILVNVHMPGLSDSEVLELFPCICGLESNQRMLIQLPNRGAAALEWWLMLCLLACTVQCSSIPFACLKPHHVPYTVQMMLLWNNYYVPVTLDMVPTTLHVGSTK